MSIVRCMTRGCPHYTREGYGDNPYMEADGSFCWRCRRKHKRSEEASLRKLRKSEEKK